MHCDDIRIALSAQLDAEDPGLPATAVDEHRVSCAGCQAWAADARSLHRVIRVRPAEHVPDLTTSILAAAAPAPGNPTRVQPVSTWRWGLFVVALTQLVVAAPALLLGEDAGATVHVARELGSFDVALAVGLLVAAWQPARAWGLIPAASALALVMGATAVLDVLHGRASGLGEAHHVLDLAGITFLWLVAREGHPREPRATRRAHWSAA
jgi:predicted anti-sigma-YlaC factor YlaD